MAEQQTPQEAGGQASAPPGQGMVSAAEIEKFISGIDFPCDKAKLMNHAREHGAPQEVLDMMEDFPDQEYSSSIDVARGISETKH